MHSMDRRRERKTIMAENHGTTCGPLISSLNLLMRLHHAAKHKNTNRNAFSCEYGIYRVKLTIWLQGSAVHVATYCTWHSHCFVFTDRSTSFYTLSRVLPMFVYLLPWHNDETESLRSYSEFPGQASENINDSLERHGLIHAHEHYLTFCNKTQEGANADVFFIS